MATIAIPPFVYSFGVNINVTGTCKAPVTFMFLYRSATGQFSPYAVFTSPLHKTDVASPDRHAERASSVQRALQRASFAKTTV